MPAVEPYGDLTTVLVEVACPSLDVAGLIGSSAVVLGLAASAHRFPVESTYRWVEEVHHASEVLLQLTTTRAAVQRLSAHVLTWHPYDVPHVVVRPVADSSAGRAWVEDAVYVPAGSGSRSRPCYVTLDVIDLPGQLAFWTELLAASAVEVSTGSEARYAVARSPDMDVRLLLQRVSEPKRGKSRMHLDIECDDLNAEVVRACAAGASVIDEFHENGFEWVVLADPEGNEFCLLEVRYPHLLREFTPR